MKGHTPLKRCIVNMTTNQQNQPHGDTKIERASKDNDDSHSSAAQRLMTRQCNLTHFKSESILEQISKKFSPVPEHEVSSAEKPTVTSKTAAISNNGDSLSAKTARNLFKTTMNFKIPQLDHAAFLDSQTSSSKVTSTVLEDSDRKADKSTSDNTMSSKVGKSFDHTHRVTPTVSLHTRKTDATNATSLLSPRSSKNNINGNKVTEYQESDLNSSAQNVCSKVSPSGPVSSQTCVIKNNSSAAKSNHIDINFSLNSATSVQSSSTIKKQELNSVEISNIAETSNRQGNVRETIPHRLCSETASTYMSDAMLLHHTTATASAIATPKEQNRKCCGTCSASQQETKTAAECDDNQDFVAQNLRTAHSGNNLSVQHGNKTGSKFENAPTTNKIPHKIKPMSKHDYPFRCTTCRRILKCVRDIEKHYNRHHPRQDVRLTERKSGFVYSNSGKPGKVTQSTNARRSRMCRPNGARTQLCRKQAQRSHVRKRETPDERRRRRNSGKCLRWKDDFKAPTDSHLCSYCAFRSMKRFRVENHIRRVHPKREVRVFSLCMPNTGRHRIRSESTSKVTALPHEASSSNSPTPSSYFCNVCSDVKNSEFQFRLHMASHPCYKYTTQRISERRFKCFMCEHDSHRRINIRAHIKRVHNKNVDDDVGIIANDKQRSVDSRHRLVNIKPRFVLINLFKQQPNYLWQLILAHGIKSFDFIVCGCLDTLKSKQFGRYFATEK